MGDHDVVNNTVAIVPVTGPVSQHRTIEDCEVPFAAEIYALGSKKYKVENKKQEVSSKYQVRSWK